MIILLHFLNLSVLKSSGISGGMGKRNPHQDLDHVKIQNRHLHVLYYGVDLALEIQNPLT